MAPPGIEERVGVIRQHLQRAVEWKGLKAGVNEMRRHYTNYLRGLPNIREYRLQLVTISELEQIDAVLDEIARTYQGYEFTPRQMDFAGAGLQL